MARVTQQGTEAVGLDGRGRSTVGSGEGSQGRQQLFGWTPSAGQYCSVARPGPEWPWRADTEAVGKGFCRKTDIDASHSKEAD